MQAIKSYFQRFLSLLRIRTIAAGLEVSDQVLRFVYADKGRWSMEAIRLEPGILEKGSIKDAPALAAALGELRSRVPSLRKKGAKMNVVVSLSSVNMYAQVFTLPTMMEGEGLDKAISLNVQMASPVDIAHAYYGWQLLGHDEAGLRLEVAAAFVDKNLVDAIVQALYTAGFVTIGVESRALSLMRFMREGTTGIEAEKSYLLLDVDNSGIDFLIVRKGQLYFEYANQWADIADEKGQISVEKFEEVLGASLRQVTNFYAQRWQDPLAGVVVSATAFTEEAVRAVGASVPLPVIPLTLAPGVETSPEWFVAFGCALRGLNANMKDKEINLSGDEALDTFREERILNFMNLWRVMVPSVLGFLLVVLFLVNGFLNTVRSGIEAQPAFSEHGAEAAQVAALEASSTAFNQEVSLVADAENQISDNYLIISDINTIAGENDVSIDQISFPAASSPITVTGVAPSTDQIVSFKNAIQSDPKFGTVTLPLLDIQQDGTAGGYSFTASFPLAQTSTSTKGSGSNSSKSWVRSQ